MSLPEVARYLRMKERTIYVWAHDGKIPGFKLGSSWRFRREEIEAWLETQRSGPAVLPAARPLVPPVSPQPTKWQEQQQERAFRQSMIDQCRDHIETTLRVEDQSVFRVDRFLDDFDDDVVQEVVRQLKREKKIIEREVKDRDGEKVKVIRKRK